MATPVKDRRPGRSRRTFWIDDQLYAQAQKLAKADRSSVTDLVERGLKEAVTKRTVSTVDTTLGPIIDRVLQDQLRRTESSLRELIFVVALEVLRSQYVALNTAVQAGVDTRTVAEWRQKGWEFGAEELRRHQQRLRQLAHEDEE